MPSIFSDEHATDPALEPIEGKPDASRIFIPDAFSNPEHLRYVLGGTLAAMLCYVFYVSLDWRNLSTPVTTCVLTALTTVGSSRQKQVLRIAGLSPPSPAHPVSHLRQNPLQIAFLHRI